MAKCRRVFIRREGAWQMYSERCFRTHVRVLAEARKACRFGHKHGVKYRIAVTSEGSWISEVDCKHK